MITGGLEQQLLTIREAAKLLRCSKAHLSNVLNGKVRNVPPLSSVRLGRRRLIVRRSLASWITTVEGDGHPPPGGMRFVKDGSSDGMIFERQS